MDIDNCCCCVVGAATKGGNVLQDLCMYTVLRREALVAACGVA
jgi:hypothetical protein